MTDKIQWSDRVALVTGASSGIGASIARKLLDHGARVIGLSLDEAGLKATLGESDRAHLIPFDLGNIHDIEAALSKIPAGFQGINTLVNCAAHDVGGRVPFDQHKMADVLSILNVNLAAAIIITQSVIQKMVSNNIGDIVNIGSVAAREPATTLAAYSTTKHGVAGFSAALRNDYAHTDLRIMHVIPGTVRTNFAATRFGGDPEKGEAYYDLRASCLTPDQVADTIVWALDQPPEVTIAELFVLPTRLK